MHTVAATENQHQHQLVERALAQLGELESRLLAWCTRPS